MYINPYENISKTGDRRLKANFHTHAGADDVCGVYDLEEVVKLYREAGYSVLTISNHDFFTDTSYLAKKYDIGLINGFEYSQNNHMLCIGCKDFIKGEHQTVIDECNSQGGFVILCHPNWQHKEYWPWSKIDGLTGYTGIEVFNGVIGRLNGTGLAEDTWDHILSGGRLVWGFGNDDFHRWFDLNKSWSMIFAASNDEKDVKSAIAEGCFYISSGLYLDEFSLYNNTIRIKASENDCYPMNHEYIFKGKNGEILYRTKDKYAEYELKGNEEYVRMKVVGEQGYALWTQPVYRQDLLSRT